VTAYDLEMQERYDAAREEEASPTLMPIEMPAYEYVYATAQHQDTHVDGEQCDACACNARALHSRVAPVVAIVVLEEAASRVAELRPPSREAAALIRGMAEQERCDSDLEGVDLLSEREETSR
jgi:hypothetical protein